MTQSCNSLYIVYAWQVLLPNCSFHRQKYLCIVKNRDTEMQLQIIFPYMAIKKQQSGTRINAYFKSHFWFSCILTNIRSGAESTSTHVKLLTNVDRTWCGRMMSLSWLCPIMHFKQGINMAKADSSNQRLSSLVLLWFHAAFFYTCALHLAKREYPASLGCCSWL